MKSEQGLFLWLIIQRGYKCIPCAKYSPRNLTTMTNITNGWLGCRLEDRFSSHFCDLMLFPHWLTCPTIALWGFLAPEWWWQLFSWTIQAQSFLYHTVGVVVTMRPNSEGTELTFLRNLGPVDIFLGILFHTLKRWDIVCSRDFTSLWNLSHSSQ